MLALMTVMCFDGVMRLPALSVSGEDRVELESWVRARTIDARYAQRARIVLLAADGESNRAIGDAVGMHYNQVAVWRRRYVEFGVEGLDDEARPGRPPVYDHDDVILLVKTVTEPPPDPATRWTMDLLAARMAEHGVPISASQAWRICKALDLKPWQTESWMTSHDPDFWAKAGDVCGLYLNPPENAVVWSVDEKSQIQAKSRVNPTRPAVPGARRRRDYGYVRHGTAVLFAGLNVHDGTVAGWVTDSTRGTNFVEFLTDLVAQTPRHLELHCIVDNFSAHGTPAVEQFLDTHPRVFLHNTPTHASWLNQVELFFSILERRVLKHGEFDSVDELTTQILAFINDYNRHARAFRWTYDGRPLKVA
jgi:transposase